MAFAFGIASQPNGDHFLEDQWPLLQRRLQELRPGGHRSQNTGLYEAKSLENEAKISYSSRENLEMHAFSTIFSTISKSVQLPGPKVALPDDVQRLAKAIEAGISCRGHLDISRRIVHMPMYTYICTYCITIVTSTPYSGLQVGLKRCATGEEQAHRLTFSLLNVLKEEPKSFWRALKAAAEFWEGFLPSLEA